MEITFKDISRIIKKNIVFVIITAFLFSLATFFFTNVFVPKTYKTVVKLYIDTSFTDSSVNESLQSYNYAEKLVATCIQMLNTNKFCSVISDEMDGKYTPSQIKSMVTFSGIESTEIFQASVVSENPADAKKIADAIAVEAPIAVSEFNKNAHIKVVDDATVPKSPTSPNVLKYAMIAFIVGIVFALVISFIRDYFDVKVKYNDDMITICNVPILAAIPDFESFSNSNSGSSKSQPST